MQKSLPPPSGEYKKEHLLIVWFFLLPIHDIVDDFMLKGLALLNIHNTLDDFMLKLPPLATAIKSCP
jgi:hypothetical protein